MIPADFPPPPLPPSASVPVTDVAWYNYAKDLQAYIARLVIVLKG